MRIRERLWAAFGKARPYLYRYGPRVGRALLFLAVTYKTYRFVINTVLGTCCLIDKVAPGLTAAYLPKKLIVCPRVWALGQCVVMAIVYAIPSREQFAQRKAEIMAALRDPGQSLLIDEFEELSNLRRRPAFVSYMIGWEPEWRDQALAGIRRHWARKALAHVRTARLLEGSMARALALGKTSDMSVGQQWVVKNHARYLAEADLLLDCLVATDCFCCMPGDPSAALLDLYLVLSRPGYTGPFADCPDLDRLLF